MCMNCVTKNNKETIFNNHIIGDSGSVLGWFNYYRKSGLTLTTAITITLP